MKIKAIRLVGVRVFEDSSEINLSPQCNIFVGPNNAGKSTILKAVTGYQSFASLDGGDVRPGSSIAYIALRIRAGQDTSYYGNIGSDSHLDLYLVRALLGNSPHRSDVNQQQISAVFSNTRPQNYMEIFSARRKALAFDLNINAGMAARIDGTLSNLYSRIDILAVAGHPQHSMFRKAVNDIIGIDITTRPAGNGKEAGYYFDRHTFISLDKMGDGVSEMVALIVELCLAENKLFILEEPETNLHPKGLKALLDLVRESWEYNQFMIATHSNIVVSQLGYDENTTVFKLAREDESAGAPSKVTEVPRDAIAHADLLRELGYEFADLGLHDGWLFLEESSAESIIRDVLIPEFAPSLVGRLRTFAAGGATKIEPSISDFQRLVTFVHLQPAYKGKLWVRADGDAAGVKAITEIKANFKYLTPDECSTFSKVNFEDYYPARFASQAAAALSISDKQKKRVAKAELVKEVMVWSSENAALAKNEWEISAAELIGLVRNIEKAILQKKESKSASEATTAP